MIYEVIVGGTRGAKPSSRHDQPKSVSE